MRGAGLERGEGASGTLETARLGTKLFVSVNTGNTTQHNTLPHSLPHSRLQDGRVQE